MNDKHQIRNSYPCNLVINDWQLTSLEISQYYKTKPGREKITDELIIKIVVEKLNGERLTPDLKKRSSNWTYFTLKAIQYENKLYRLICCHENNSSVWGVLNTYPIKKRHYEKD